MSKNATQRHRSFSSSAEGNIDDLDPVTFEVEGETFTAKPDIQGIVLMDFLEASDGGGVSSIVAFKGFLKDALDEEEFNRFNEFLRTSKKKISVETIAGIVAYLVEEYTERPTTASAQ